MAKALKVSESGTLDVRKAPALGELLARSRASLESTKVIHFSTSALRNLDIRSRRATAKQLRRIADLAQRLAARVDGPVVAATKKRAVKPTPKKPSGKGASSKN